MQLEPTPDDAPEPPPKPPTSDKQIAANRRNALLSTGPKTASGKDRSRTNALKHGLCAMVLDVPGEDAAVFGTRLNEWNGELNPRGSSVDGYLVSLMTRHSINIDRCFSVQTAKVAQLARDAIKDYDEEVARDVEDLLVHLTETQQYKERKLPPGLKYDYLKIGPPPQPGHAVRRLMATSRGCQALFEEWDLLKPAMVEPVTWDSDDAIRANNLMGISSSARGESCNPLALSTYAIKEHRDVALKLKNNLIPGDAPWGECYTSQAAHQADRDRIEELSDIAALGGVQINTVIDGQQRMIRICQREREQEEVLTRSEATFRARFDASDDGKLLYRYQAEQHRGFIRIVELLKKQVKEAAKAFAEQPVTSTGVAGPPPELPAKSTPPVARNEAIEESSANPSKGSKVVESERKASSPKSKKGRQARRRGR